MSDDPIKPLEPTLGEIRDATKRLAEELSSMQQIDIHVLGHFLGATEEGRRFVAIVTREARRSHHECRAYQCDWARP